ncbi:MAG TPA: peptidylprolyl isomerase [Longimicrobiales bacterium]|nr:peptidylprolyl isomerase [Longimicrobiales bacterium]
MRRYLALFFLLFGVSLAEAQQQPAPRIEIADKIIAVVGDSIILKSDVDLEYLQAKQGGQTIGDSVAFIKKILDRRIGELVLLQAASRDTSIQITSDQIQQEVTRDLDARRRQFGSQLAFDDALKQAGMTMEQLRNQIRQEVSGRLLMREYVQKAGRDRKPRPITDPDIRKYYAENKAMFGERPATITFAQLVIAPKASDSARAVARVKADEVLKKIREGGDFETLAKQYSEDPSSREKGGDLGWFRPGNMVREFDQVVFAMRPGDISSIVESSFGYHIIKLEKTKGAERQARHILIIPKTTASDAARMKIFADSMTEKIRGGANIDSLIKAIGDPNENAHIGPYPMDKLPAPYNTVLTGVTAGQIVGPIELPGTSEDAPKYAIVKISDVRAAGEFTLDDPTFRTQIKEQLEQGALVDELITDLRKRTLIDIRIGQ